MTASWQDFNDASSQNSLVPKAEIVKVRMTIRPGGFDDPSRGWTGGYATRSASGAVYLNCDFTVLEGPYTRRKIFSLIGLHSPKGAEWANMGRGLLRGILCSARGVSDKDNSPEAQEAWRISGFQDLDGLEFVARVDVGEDVNGEDKNEIRKAITPDHKDYARVMGTTTAPVAAAMPASGPAPTPSGTSARPHWAQ